VAVEILDLALEKRGGLVEQRAASVGFHEHERVSKRADTRERSEAQTDTAHPVLNITRESCGRRVGGRWACVARR
jgi:hypothetical protein